MADILDNKLFISGESGLPSDAIDLLSKTMDWPDGGFAYQWYTVPRTAEGRMDLVSEDIYGTPNYDVLLAKVNGIRDMLSIKAGTRIIAPAPGDVQRFASKPQPFVSVEQADAMAGGGGAAAAKKPPKQNRYSIDPSRNYIIY